LDGREAPLFLTPIFVPSFSFRHTAFVAENPPALPLSIPAMALPLVLVVALAMAAVSLFGEERERERES